MSLKQLKLHTVVLIGLLLNALGCGLDNIGNVKSEIVSSYLVSEITPAYAKAGDAITLKGTGFDSKMQVKVGGQAPEKVSFISSEEIVVLLPKDLVGLVTIIVSKDDESNKSSYLILPSQGVLLNVTEVENDVCDGQEFFTVSGKKKTGTKLCNTTSDKDPLDKDPSEKDPLEKDPLVTDPRLDAGSDPSTDPAPVASILPDCDAQTVTNCRASTSYPAVSKTLLQASDIRKDVIIGPLGLTGTLESPPACSGTSSDSCIATAAYPSIDKTIIDPAKMLDTLTLAGVTGTIVSRGNWNLSAAFPGAGYYSNVSNLPVAGDIRSSVNIIGVTGNLTPAPSNCAADGATNCVAIPTFTAATTTGLADKVLSGQTVAGVPGNVTLPAIGKVLTGTNYGITGNGSAGSLTLPAASNVLGGSGNYGDPGAPVTPLMSNRGNWNLTSGFPGAGYYASVSNAPLAGDIRSTVNIIGVLGNVTPAPSNCAADGATNCVAIPTFTAATTTGLADKVLSGQTVAGVPGNVTLPAIGKVLTGTDYGITGNGSAGTLTLPAASNVLGGSGNYGDPGAPVTPLMSNRGIWNLTSGFPGAGYYSSVSNAPLAADIRSTVNIIGVLGNVTPAPSNCAADGAINCVAIPTFTAATTTGLADKVLSGQTVAGVPGNVTLPAIGKVLTGTNYGIAGNGSSGVLTLPAASNVLSGSGIYGDPGSPVAPLMANKGVWNLTTPFQGAGYYSNVTNVPITTNIKSGIQILGETGTYSGTPLDNCNADGQSSCIASASFPSADVSSKAIPSNIRKGTNIAGVTGNYVGGGEYIVINEPSSFNDAINLNGNFTIHFTAFDSNTANGQVTLYFRLDNNSGCSGIPSNNGWSIITDTLSEDDTSYVWNTTGQPAGYYFVCAQYDANTTKYFTSVSSLAIGIPGSCIAADGVTWRNEGGGCAFYNGPTITIFSTAETFNRNSLSANTRCSDLIEGGKNDWVLINANLIEAAAYGHAVNQIVGIASGSQYWGTSNRCTLMSSTAPSIDPSCSNERTVCGRTPP